MANMDLGVGWRMRYTLDVPRTAATAAEYGTLKMSGQNSPDSQKRWQDGNFDLINDPSCGVAGPGLALSAVEFNAGSRVQRAWSRDSQVFVSTPTGFNITLWFYALTLHEGVLFTLGGNKLNNGVAIRSEGSNLTYYDGYSGLKVALTKKNFDDSDLGYWAIALEGRAATGTLLFSRRTSSATAIEAGKWYHLAITTSRDYLSEHSFIYLNAEDAWGTTDWSALAGLSSISHLSVCLADYNQIDGINGGVEGQGRFVGRIAAFGANFSKCVTTSEGTDGYMPEDRIRRQYWRGATFASPLARPQTAPARPFLTAGFSSLQRARSGGVR